MLYLSNSIHHISRNMISSSIDNRDFNEDRLGAKRTGDINSYRLKKIRKICRYSNNIRVSLGAGRSLLCPLKLKGPTGILKKKIIFF